MNTLTLSHVKKHFGEKQVLRDLSFSVPEHTIFGFIGQNGAGKTTTMKLILGLMTSDNGEIKVCGENVHYGNTTTNRYIGYLPDVPEFYSYMTAPEYLTFCGKITGMSSADIKSRREELLELVGLKNEKHRIRGFSRGMKQRLGIAQALLNRPKLLICDEPTSALDPVGRKEILDILLAAKKQTTVIFSTHILSDVERICDEIALLHDGEIVLQGTLDEIKNMHRGTGYEIELESPDDTTELLRAFPCLKRTDGSSSVLQFSGRNTPQLVMNEILSYITEHYFEVLRIEKQEPTLESLFMEVTGR